MATADKTMLVIPMRKAPMQVPRIFKRSIQISLAVAATGLVMLALMVGNSLLQTKTTIQKIIPVWYAFVMRSDIFATIVLTAVVTVCVVYWMRSNEKR